MRNLDFTGDGYLEIAADGARLVFRGKANGLFGRATSLELAREDISNVYRFKDRVTFDTPKGRSGKKKKPFLFYCHDEEQARAIVSLLPTEASEAFRKDLEQIEQLERVCPPFAWTASPTNMIIAANGAIFLLMASLAGAGWVQATDLAPYIRFGANNGGFTTDGEWHRLITSLFLHFGVAHVALNMWALAGAGHLLERLVGRANFLAIYLGSGIFGSVASILWYGDSVWSAGASGAVFGTYGAMLAFSLRAKSSLPASVFTPLRRSAIAFVAYNLIYGAAHVGIDNAAHAGGLAAGFALGLASVAPLNAKDRPQRLRRLFPVLCALGVGLAALGLTLAPKFDYIAKERLAMQEQFAAFAEEEESLLSGIAPHLERFDVDERSRGLALDGIATRLIPFYEASTRAFQEAVYTPGTSDARNRDRTQAYAATRAEAFAAISETLRNPEDQAALDRYFALIKKANRELEALE